MDAATLARFEKYVHAEPTTGCYLWTGGTQSKGYGVFNNPRGHRGVGLAHRLSYEHHVGLIPEGMHVLHRCDTPACVNPEHLFLGTNLDNIHDRMLKGRGRPRLLQCKRGHLLSGGNLILTRGGQTHACRTCKNASERRRYAQQPRS